MQMSYWIRKACEEFPAEMPTFSRQFPSRLRNRLLIPSIQVNSFKNNSNNEYYIFSVCVSFSFSFSASASAGHFKVDTCLPRVVPMSSKWHVTTTWTNNPTPATIMTQTRRKNDVNIGSSKYSQFKMTLKWHKADVKIGINIRNSR